MVLEGKSRARALCDGMCLWGRSMSTEFDASQICNDEPMSAGAIAEQEHLIEQLMDRPNAMANARLHAQNELQRIVNAANRIAWRYVPADMRAPAAEEKSALLASLSEADREKLLKEARSAVAQRRFVTRIEEAYEQCMALLQVQQAEMASRESEAREWAEFEAYDEATKAERFQIWRASRPGE
jgi:hypothetical protein